MAKSKKNAASAGPPPLWPNLAVDLRDPRLHQAGAALLALVGLILTLSTIGIVLPAAFTNAVGGAARDLLGPPGALALGLSLTGGGLWLLRALIRGQMTMPLRRVIGGEVLFFAALALLQMLFENSGGKVGWAIANVLSRNLGDLPSAGLLLLIGSVGAIWAFNLDPAQAGQWGAQMWGRWRAGPVPDWIGDGSGAGGATTAAPAPEPPAAAAEPKRERKKAAPKEKKPAAKADQPAPAASSGRRLRRDKRLPVPGDLFHTRSKLDIDREEMNERARIIEQTLDSFGIPVKVIEMQQGPTVTQFGVSPGFVERRIATG
ncbi:MAG: hypothetical protein HYR71_12240, partial [Chloroflexi bacterium]|nr:hypothetical protein [Chloroflexota bacterium]